MLKKRKFFFILSSIILMVLFVQEMLKTQMSTHNNVKSSFVLNVRRSGNLEESDAQQIVKDLSNFNNQILDSKIFL